MDTKTALEVLGISKPTYRRYRKLLGIYEETSHTISDENVMKIKKMLDASGKMPEHRQKVISEMKAFDEDGNRADILVARTFDSAQIRKLKEHYNVYSRYIDYLTQVIEDCMQDGSLPPKDVSYLIEKYETLCIKIAKELRHLEGDSDNIAQVINDKLSRYQG